MTTTATQPGNEVLRCLAHAAADVRAARGRYLAEQEAAWQRYVAVVDRALAEDLRLRPSTAPAPGHDPVHDLLASVRGRLDDLRVQAQLGRMELEDLAAELREAADRVVHHAATRGPGDGSG